MKPFFQSRSMLRTVLTGMIMAAAVFGVNTTSVASQAGGKSAVCDVHRGPCRSTSVDGMSIEFEVFPKPVKALSDLTFVVTLMKDGTPVHDAAVGLDLSMPGMFMGTNRPALKEAGTGRYEGTGVITRCPSGRRTWRANVTVRQGGKTTAADFVFTVN